MIDAGELLVEICLNVAWNTKSSGVENAAEAIRGVGLGKANSSVARQLSEKLPQTDYGTRQKIEASINHLMFLSDSFKAITEGKAQFANTNLEQGTLVQDLPQQQESRERMEDSIRAAIRNLEDLRDALLERAETHRDRLREFRAEIEAFFAARPRQSS